MRDCLDTWINLFIKDCFRYSTIASYQRTINNRIKPELGEIALKDLDEYNISSFLQFPVKWNAFSDRNGMLFSGLTEWLSDTNGMAQ